MVAFLRQVGREVYRPLSEKLKREGLLAMEEHWRTAFSVEEGEFTLTRAGDKLILRVARCPAIHHMRTHSYPVAKLFYEHTQIVNEEICHAAGYGSSLANDQEGGTCIQTFWRVED
jgi:hypothetical protein